MLPVFSQMLPGSPPAQGQPSPREMLLSQMSDVITPEPVGLWPPAPGWWLLALLLFILLAVSVLAIWRHRRQNRYKKFALAELDAIQRNFSGFGDDHGNAELAQAVNAVLKKTALNAYPHSRNRLAALYGRQWLVFLDRAAKKPAPQKPDENWIEKMYQSFASGEAIDRVALQHYARHWVRYHAKLNPLQVDQLLNDQPEPEQAQPAEANYV